MYVCIIAFRFKLTLTKRVRRGYMSSSLFTVSVAPTLGPGTGMPQPNTNAVSCVVLT
eukprot:SAG31_NODE_5005_length_2806_cov_61.751016_4_plen_57_part_00